MHYRKQYWNNFTLSLLTILYGSIINMIKFTLQAFHQLQVLTAYIQMQHYVKYLVKYFANDDKSYST